MHTTISNHVRKGFQFYLNNFNTKYISDKNCNLFNKCEYMIIFAYKYYIMNNILLQTENLLTLRNYSLNNKVKYL